MKREPHYHSSSYTPGYWANDFPVFSVSNLSLLCEEYLCGCHRWSVREQILFKCNVVCSSCNISSNLDAIRCVTHHLCVPRTKQIFLVELQRASDCRLSITEKDFWVEGGWAQRWGWIQMPNKTPKTRICEKERAWSKYAFISESLIRCPSFTEKHRGVILPCGLGQKVISWTPGN